MEVSGHGFILSDGQYERYIARRDSFYQIDVVKSSTYLVIVIFYLLEIKSLRPVYGTLSLNSFSIACKSFKADIQIDIYIQSLARKSFENLSQNSLH